MGTRSSRLRNRSKPRITKREAEPRIVPKVKSQYLTLYNHLYPKPKLVPRYAAIPMDDDRSMSVIVRLWREAYSITTKPWNKPFSFFIREPTLHKCVDTWTAVFVRQASHTSAIVCFAWHPYYGGMHRTADGRFHVNSVEQLGAFLLSYPIKHRKSPQARLDIRAELEEIDIQGIISSLEFEDDTYLEI